MHEVDFVLAHRRDEVNTIECKWDPSSFDSTALRVFWGYYPKGNNYLVCPSSLHPYLKKAGNLEIKVCDPAGIAT
ncbi:MAG: hypothetical protein WCL11_28365 [Verrucomicrobiota bacterium]